MTIEVGASPTQLTRDDLHCPLCNYSLRGLAQPRCPECGHAFDWDALLSFEQRRDRSLFEASPQRNVRSFLRSFFNSFLPRRLFRSMNVSESFRVRRLLLYWLMNVGIAMFVGGAFIARDIIATRSMLQEDRQFFLNNAQTPFQRQATIQNWGSVANLLATFPQVTWKDAFNRYTGKDRGPVPLTSPMAVLFHGRGGAVFLEMLAAAVAWPWLTLLALISCRSTLKRARIKPAQLLRCVVYSCDTSVLLAGILSLTALHWIGLELHSAVLLISFRGAFIFMSFVSVLFIFVTYRLWMAHALYLRLPSSFAIAAATQVIVLLLMLVFAVKFFRV